MMRILMWFTIGFAAACALGTYFWLGSALLLFALVGVAGFAACMALRKHEACRRAAMVFVGFTLGIVWTFGYDAVYVRPVRQLDGQTVQLEVTASTYSWDTAVASAVDGRITLNGKDYTVRIYLKEPMQLEPGDGLRMKGTLRLTTDGGESEPTYHRSNGILALCYQKGELERFEGELTPQVRWDRFTQNIRRRVTGCIDEVFSANSAALAKALLIGDRSDIDYELSTAFKLSGISHIIAVSGLHVSMLYALVFWLSGSRRSLLALLGIPITVLFMAVAAFSPSVTRAGLMQILMILALCIDREYDPPTALSFSVLIMLVLNPLVSSSVGFQLSVGSVCGIFLFSEPLRQWLLLRIPGGKNDRLKGLRSAIAVGISTTLSAQVMTAPLVAAYFHVVSLVGVFTNLAVLWAVNWIFWGVIAVCLIGLLWLAPAKLLAWVVSVPIAYVIAAAKLFAGIPLSAVYVTGVYMILWLVLAYLLILTIPMHRRPLFSGAIGLIGLCLALLLSWGEPALHEHWVTVLDVGQGQCVVLRSGENTFVVDCGGDYAEDAADICADYLLSIGVSRIDGLILSHYDADHSAGAPYLMSRIDVDRLFLPPGEAEETASILAATDGEIIWVEQDLHITAPTAEISLFAPGFASSSNERSVAVLFQTENCDTLITGDMSVLREQLLLRRAGLPDLELLVVGHHGSSTSTSEELLEELQPEYAVISVGKDNPYDHPSQEVLQRLYKAGCTVYRTDQMGTVQFRR